MKNNEPIHITLPNKAEYLELAQFFVREIARTIGFRGNALNQIDIAVEEGVSNIMKHGYDAEESQTFGISCVKIPGGIKIILHETGIPFDPNRIAKFNLTKNVADLSTDGLGIYMMQKVMDDLSFHNLGHRGKETHMVKYLAEKEVEITADVMMEEHLPAPETVREKIEFTVRPMEEHEAIEVSRCAYISHGYSFFDDHIYYPDRLVEMNRSGEMFSLVAVTNDNVFMGHTALVFQYPEDKIAELTFAFVNMEFRGQGALNRLTEYLFTVKLKRELTGIYAYAVANHVFTQKSMLKFQINDCGILLATSPALWKFKGISDDTSQRISVVLGFKYTVPPRRLTLYPPEHHRDMVGRLYGSILTEHDLAVPPDKAVRYDKATGVLKTGINELESCGEIYLASYGEDTLVGVRKTLRRMCVQHIEAINLFLPLENSLTYFLTAEFEAMGFFFAGILPGTRIGDTLILQYLNNVDFDYRKVVIYQEFTKELLEYIRARDPNEDLKI